METRCYSTGCHSKATCFAFVLSPEGNPSDIALCNDHIPSLGMEYCLPDPRRFDRRSLTGFYEPCTLTAVLFTYDPEQFSLILTSKDKRGVLVVPTGYIEASSVRNVANKNVVRYPTTHDLTARLVQTLGASFIEAAVKGYDPETSIYNCHLTLQTSCGKVEVECRVSDAVALSIVTNLPIKIDTGLLGKRAGGSVRAQ